MKKLILLSLLFFPNYLVAQVYTFKCYEASVFKHSTVTDPPIKYKNGVLIVVNLDKEKVDIYTDNEHHFNIAKYLPGFDTSGYRIFPFNAVDESGTEVYTELWFPGKEKEEKGYSGLLSIQYDKFSVNYQLIKN